jgi:FKBP12-rapamycin complex-associated protein
LEEASQLYFGEQNVDGMLRVLAPLHHIVERLGAETLHEISFAQTYGRELREANEWCRKYRETGREEELNQAWDLYYHVFKRINKQLPSLTTLELKYVSPRLLSAKSLELCVPGELRARRSRRVRRKRDDRGVRAYDARHHVETTPTKVTHSRL